MTREEIKNTPEIVDFMLDKSVIADSRMKLHKRLEEICELAIEALEQQPCEDTISKSSTLTTIIKNLGIKSEDYLLPAERALYDIVKDMPPVTPQQKIGRCKDCRRWKDSDGVYRRGVGAESQCPINCREVYEGNGYCFMYAPQEKGKQAESEK